MIQFLKDPLDSADTVVIGPPPKRRVEIVLTSEPQTMFHRRDNGQLTTSFSWGTPPGECGSLWFLHFNDDVVEMLPDRELTEFLGTTLLLDIYQLVENRATAIEMTQLQAEAAVFINQQPPVEEWLEVKHL